MTMINLCWRISVDIRFLMCFWEYKIWTTELYDVSRTDLVPAYVRILRDNEAEVRIAAAGKVTKFCKIVSPDLAIQHILPCVKVTTNPP